MAAIWRLAEVAPADRVDAVTIQLAIPSPSPIIDCW
jgi:hypothetical protein